MPQLGETVAEGKILTWFKTVGDDIEVGDKLFEVETDKVTVEVEATTSGYLTEIKVQQGQTAKVGVVVAVVGNSDGTEKPVSQDTTMDLLPFEEVRTPLQGFGKAKSADGIAISPLARRLIASRGGDIGAVYAIARSRDLRRISERDVENILTEKTLAHEASPVSAMALPGIGAPLSSIRQKIADRLSKTWRSIPHVFQGVEVDFTAVAEARAKHTERFRSQYGISLTYLPFVAHATCLALSEFSDINAHFDGHALYPSRDINLGIAVDLNHRGLVVPVIKGAGDLTVEGLAKAINRMIEKARSNRLAADDMSGGTYSISNNGAFGTMFTSPIINAPQVAILSMDAVRKHPYVIETPQGDFIGARLTGIIGQSFDHRAFDGAYSAAFLSRLKSIIETRHWSDDLTG